MPMMTALRKRMMHTNGLRERMPDLEHLAEKLPDWDTIAQRVPALERARERMPEWETVRETVTTPPATTSIAYSLLGTGAGMTWYMIATRRRGMWAWVVPAVLLTAGLALMFGGYSRSRGMRIDDAELAVREQLTGLGPFARARVLRDVEGAVVGPLVRRMPRR